MGVREYMTNRAIELPKTATPASTIARTDRLRWLEARSAAYALIALTTLVEALTAWAYTRNAAGYVDNGDGYYLYAAHRVARGAVLYRDVMGTQPPVVFLLGAVAVKLGATLPAMRLVSATARALTTLLLYMVGRRLFENRFVAALGALTYSLLPIGLTWDRSFDVNPPLTLAAVAAVWALIRLTPVSAAASGALAAVALFTKDLYAPLLVATLLYLAIHHRRTLLLPYLSGLVGGLTALAGTLLAYAGPSGLHDAFLGQQSSPLNVEWLVAAVAYVAASEGGIVLVAIAGAWLCRRDRTARGFAPWWLAGTGAVLLATLKEGTAGPVFQLAEPAVALLAAYAAVAAVCRCLDAISSVGDRRPAAASARRGQDSRSMKPSSTGLIRALRTLAPALPAALALSLLSLSGSDGAALWQTNATQTARVVALVRAHAPAGAMIVAPPYYAVLTGTRIPGDAADTYILAQGIRRRDPEEIGLLGRIDADLTARRIPIVLIDLRLAAIGPLMAALRARYHPIYADTLPPALHVVVWAP